VFASPGTNNHLGRAATPGKRPSTVPDHRETPSKRRCVKDNDEGIESQVIVTCCTAKISALNEIVENRTR
jgi:hypothetical protein